MNKKALATFLRQILCLLLTIKLASGFIYVYAPIACLRESKSTTVMPLKHTSEQDAYQIGKNAIFCYISSLGALIICWTLIGFAGVIFLHSRQLINFSFGVGSLLSSILEFTASRILAKFLAVFDDLIIDPIKSVFIATNGFTDEAIDEFDYNSSALYDQKYVNGWNQMTKGSTEDKAHVDFIQFKLKCCGFEGRHFWDTSIPRSCCSQKYFGSSCMLATANSKSCVEEYNNLVSCLFAIRVASILFGCISVITGIVALGITQMQIIYPDEEYKSDTSSDTQNTVY